MADEYTEDSIWSPQIRIRQPARGYRFAIDAVLLAHFLRCDADDDVLEAGCGSGVIAVLLSHLQRFSSLVCVEIQEDLADLARHNIRQNHLVNTEVLCADIREVSGLQVNLLYSNPPYRKAGSGRLNPQEQKAIARHEIRMKLEDLFAAASKLLKPEGRVTTILPDFRGHDFRELIAAHGYSFTELQYVHSFSSEPPAFFLSTICRVRGPLMEHPPLVIYDSPGNYSAAMQRLLTL